MSQMAATAGAQAQQQVLAQISTAVAKQSLDAVKDQGEQMVGMIQDVAQTQQELTQAEEPGKGRLLDMTG
jgi:HPt (histidine-containing phosphotransfer) domain-containing protein